jgi:hypothetical protein
MADFPVHAYPKKELAMCYFPDSADAHNAVTHLMRWIGKCKPLMAELQRAHYHKNDRWFTPRQVRIILDFLGEP